MSRRRQLDVRGGRLAVFVGHGEDDVALWVGAFHLAGEHAAVGRVEVEGAVEEGGEVGFWLCRWGWW